MQEIEVSLAKAEKIWGNQDLLDESVQARVFEKMSEDLKLRKKITVIDFALGPLRPWTVYRSVTQRIIADILKEMGII